MDRRKLGKKLCLCVTIIAVVCCIGLLFHFGILKPNNPSRAQYPVRGVDVSAYQGDIDWEVLSRQGIAFAFIKATEGSSYVDEYFEANFTGARQTSLKAGAYHFFSFDSPGETQADNFIAHVPIVSGALPPVVDFEFYDGKEENPPDPDGVRKELNDLLDRLETHYGTKPIIYSTNKTYGLYLAGYYEGYDIWIRNILTAPKPLENQEWTFWQYTNRERLDGYGGPEYYIDMNVFNGTIDDFANYAKYAESKRR